MKIEQRDGLIVAEGLLAVSDTDGGFSPDLIEIDGTDLVEFIAALFGLKTDGRGSLGNRNLGRVRLILERLPSDADGPGPTQEG